MTIASVTSAEEAAEILRQSGTVRVLGSGSAQRWRRPGEPVDLELQVTGRGIVEYDVADQVVVVRAGTTITELQEELGSKGQCIPIGAQFGNGVSGTVGGQVAMNLPHALEGSCGNWRDWVLGMIVVRSDGQIAKIGSKAVKSVAGYDVAKLMVGSRGTLAVFTELILRTFPTRALPTPEWEPDGPWPESGYVQRTLPSDFDRAVDACSDRLIMRSSRSSTLYISAQSPLELARFAGDWVMGWGLGESNYQIEDPAILEVARRCKSTIDNRLKLNPGEMF